MLMKRLILVSMGLLLAACDGGTGNVRETLGIARSAPDEFKVVSRPPLSVPPEFRLVKPTPGAPPRNIAPASKRAAALILSDSEESSDINLDLGLGGMDGFKPQADTSLAPVMSSALESAADARFLGRAGTDAADAEIRSKLSSGDIGDAPAASSLFALPDLLGGGDAASAEVVDPRVEAARIRENLDADMPVADVPVVEAPVIEAPMVEDAAPVMPEPEQPALEVELESESGLKLEVEPKLELDLEAEVPEAEVEPALELDLGLEPDLEPALGLEPEEPATLDMSF